MVRPSSADINTAQPMWGNYPQKISVKAAHFGFSVHGEQLLRLGRSSCCLDTAGHNGICVHATRKSRSALRHQKSPSGQ
jgi:hypothetical protein